MDYEKTLKELENKQKASVVAQLEAKKNEAQRLAEQTKMQGETTLNKQEQTTRENYTGQKQGASVQSQLGAKNFAEFLANRGLTTSGTAVAENMNRENNLNRVLSSLGKAENTAYTDIANNRTGLGTSYNQAIQTAGNQFNTDVASNYANIESDTVTKLLAYKEQLRREEEDRRALELERAYNERQAALEFERQKELKALDYSQNYADTLPTVENLNNTMTQADAIMSRVNTTPTTKNTILNTVSKNPLTGVSIRDAVNFNNLLNNAKSQSVLAQKASTASKLW